MEDNQSDASLQEAFLRWKLTKQKAAMSSEKDRPAVKAKEGSVSRERKQELRAMVVEIARSFIGVPYAKRVHGPAPESCCCEGCSTSGRQLGCEPLFLDCCGLVRKVMRRIGVKLGPGNQSYQFDSLPVRVRSVAELEPGDLIFYSGTPFDPDAKRHKFDMMHVEIFVGGASGEATIGSRDRFKWVNEYESYRFDSKRWQLQAHHFCKLDPWLDGSCQPMHPELWPVPWGTADSEVWGSSNPRSSALCHGDQCSIFAAIDTEAGQQEQEGQQADADV